ncbi:MAG: hypothetical protein ACO1RX_00890 [Candidatus Sericytochromatia bacterium]
MTRHVLLASLLALSLSAPALAEFPSNWYVEGINSLLSGNVVSTAIQADGAVSLSAELKAISKLNQAGVLDAVQLPDGQLVVATTQSGAVYLTGRNQEPKALLTLEKGLITAVAADSKGRIYAASAPDGKIYAGTAQSGLKEIYSGDNSYIWDLLVRPDGSLYFATGSNGALYELRNDQAKQLFKSQENNLRVLWQDSHWGLVIGGGSKGVLYRYRPDDNRVEALLDTGFEEITAITGDGKGHLFVATNRSQPQKNQNKSAVFVVNPQGQSEVLFPMDGETAYSLALDKKGDLFIGTGDAGRIYEIQGPLAADRRLLSLPARSEAKQVSALLPRKEGGLFVFGSSPAMVEEYGSGFQKTGVYESDILATELPSSWGMLHVNSLTPPGTKIVAFSRTGNTRVPDATWSPWSAAYQQPEEVRIASPRGRYLQLKFELQSSNPAVTPRLHSFEVSFVRDNLPPMLHQVFFLQRGVFLTTQSFGRLEGPRTLEITPELLYKMQSSPSTLDAYYEPMSAAAQPDVRMLQQYQPGMLTLAWDAEDPNRDGLRYDVHYQLYGESGWKVMAKDLNLPLHSFNTATLIDGRYRFRVYARDHVSNPGGGYQVFRDSELILIDNTAPVVRNLNARIQGDKLEISFEAEDQHSQVAYAEYTLDGQQSGTLNALDGIMDSRKESFRFPVPKPTGKGSHFVVVKVVDRLGNSSTGKATFEVN